MPTQHQHFTSSPPCSTSLPEHWQYNPPPTDGPNTRARLSRGLPPRSGTTAPLPTRLVAQAQDGYGAEAGEEEPWESWQCRGVGSSQQYLPSVAEGSASTASYYIFDPSLAFDPSSISSMALAALGNEHPLPKPRAPLFRSDRSTSSSPVREERRFASNATIIDHGSPDSSPPRLMFHPASSSMSTRPGSVANGIGMTKEEWLRLGGFMEEEPGAPSQAQQEDIFSPAPSRAYAFPYSAHPALPAPPASVSSTPSTYVLSPVPLPLTPLPPPREFEVPPDLALDQLPLPTPPPPFASKPSSRYKTRRAPCPAIPTRLRHEPYPTSSSSANLPLVASTPRKLTPVSTALASYHDSPVPSAPPPPSESPKKSHGRRVSVGHIPRPRNAFILFRSHAVSSGLIPRSMGITDHKNISQIVGSVWRGLSGEERRRWDELAEEEKRAHREKYPDYVFKPKQKGQRAPAGMGKKARAKKAREEEERAKEARREQQALGEQLAGGDDEQDDDEKPSRPRSGGAWRTEAGEDERRSRRKMELIGQAVLEGEDDDRISRRVDEELSREDFVVDNDDIDVEPAPFPFKIKRKSASSKPPVSTPRKTRSATQQQRLKGSPSSDILVNSLPTSPASSTSTVSPSRRTPTKRGGLGRGVASPTSSASPSPQRMQQPGLRDAVSPPSSSTRHPLARSHPSQDTQHDDDLPVSRRRKDATYASAGLGLAHPAPSSSSPMTLPPTPFSLGGPSPTFSPSQPTLSAFGIAGASSAFAALGDIPLFSGGADSRQFSLGRWELRKPSGAPISRREMLAQEEEAQAQEQALEAYRRSSTAGLLDDCAAGAEGAGRERGRGSGRISSALTLDPTEFLTESGLEGVAQEQGSSASGSSCDAWATSSYALPDPRPFFATAPHLSASSFLSYRYATPPTTHARIYEPLFATSSIANEHPADLFHFGPVDLFAKPPPALLPSKRGSE
ncbi:SPOSA6832_03957, partial [Sporobolomyces salmonicolor]